jgi:hypothetical protein
MGVDAIQEFSVVTGNYSAGYGKTSGGIVKAISKSGTNAFHGDVCFSATSSWTPTTALQILLACRNRLTGATSSAPRPGARSGGTEPSSSAIKREYARRKGGPPPGLQSFRPTRRGRATWPTAPSYKSTRSFRSSQRSIRTPTGG